MSIASEITRLQLAKADIKTAIENKGVTVAEGTKLDSYAGLVADIHIQNIPEEGTPLEYANVVWKNSTNVRQTAVTNGEYLDINYDSSPIVNFVIVWSDYQGSEQWDPSKVQYTEQEYGGSESSKIAIPVANITSESSTAGDVGYRFVSVQMPQIFVQTGGHTDVRLYYDNQLIAYMGVSSDS